MEMCFGVTKCGFRYTFGGKLRVVTYKTDIGTEICACTSRLCVKLELFV